jgi:hypothetical protein
MIPILLCIDVEPDERSPGPDDRAEWAGFEETCRLLNRFRWRLAAAAGRPVNFGWFFRMDPQIAHVYGAASWPALRYRRLIDELGAAGDELGLHVHPWRWEAGSRRWIEDFADQAWVEHCVRSAFEAFAESMGTPCRAFRFGDRWMSDAALGLLEALGARVDLTPEPGQNVAGPPEPFLGRFPDYTGVPRRPYRPARSDFTRAGVKDARDLWVIPLSAGSVHPRFLAFDRRPATSTWLITRHGQARTGHITADPNPLLVSRRGECGVTTLSWTASGVGAVEVRVGAADGAVFARTEGAGTATTGRWVSNGMVFHLLDASDGRTPAPDDTLATVKVTVTTDELPPAEAASGAECMTLDLAFDSLLVRRIADALLSTLARPYLACVARSDVGIRPAPRANLEETLEHLLWHPRRERFAFETPSAMARRLDETGSGSG